MAQVFLVGVFGYFDECVGENQQALLGVVARLDGLVQVGIALGGLSLKGLDKPLQQHCLLVLLNTTGGRYDRRQANLGHLTAKIGHPNTFCDSASHIAKAGETGRHTLNKLTHGFVGFFELLLLGRRDGGGVFLTKLDYFADARTFAEPARLGAIRKLHLNVGCIEV